MQQSSGKFLLSLLASNIVFDANEWVGGQRVAGASIVNAQRVSGDDTLISSSKLSAQALKWLTQPKRGQQS